eukprot:3573688-Prymnesium_polylepis.1
MRRPRRPFRGCTNHPGQSSEVGCACVQGRHRAVLCPPDCWAEPRKSRSMHPAAFPRRHSSWSRRRSNQQRKTT